MTARTLTAGFVLAVTILIVAPLSVSAQDNSESAIQAWHPVLAASVERLAAQSTSWREAMKAVTATGRRAVLITPDKFDGVFEADTLAQAEPIVIDQSRVDVMLVVVNLELLQKLSGLQMTAVDFEDDVDRILAHEVYGHAVPVLLAGTLAAKCADPAAGQSAIASCAVQRENVIRREMRLGQRIEYGRDSLAIAKRSKQ
jgi:hypothetical protein